MEPLEPQTQAAAVVVVGQAVREVEALAEMAVAA